MFYLYPCSTKLEGGILDSPCLSSHQSIRPFIAIDRSNVHAKGQDQRSKVKVTEVKTQFSYFGTITPVWIHIWRWNHAQCLMWHRRGARLFFKVIHQISRSHGTKEFAYFVLNWAFPDGNSSLNKIWWLCLVPTSTTRFASDVEYRMAKIVFGYIRK